MSLVDLLISRATQTKQPISGTFELTARCNLSCKMCYIHNRDFDASIFKNELTTEQWIDIADQAAENGTLLLLLTGGEPTLRPDFCKIYRACAERGFLLTVNTNGTLLTDEMFELFKEHPPLRMNVSLYGACEETYAELCGHSAAFYSVVENIKRLRSLGVAVQINFSATPYNHHEAKAVYDFAQSVGAQMQHTAYMFPPTRTACQDCFQRFSPEEAALVMIEYMRLSHSSDDFSAYCKRMLSEALPRLDDCGNIYDGVRCRAGRAAFWVTYEGKMLPCGMIPNITSSVLELGFAQSWSNTVAAFSNVKAPEGCLSCEHYSRCDVCPAISFAEKHDLSAVPNYICEKNHAYRSALLSIVKKSEEESCV